MIRLATVDDASQILNIYRPVVEHTFISFETTPPTEDEMRCRITKVQAQLPWLVLQHDGQIIGYAYASKHNDRAAYQWSVDVAVYIRETSRRMGVGRALYDGLLPALRMLGVHNAVAIIALPNRPSVSMHESLGFKLVGVYPKFGYKLGMWHDVGHWLLRLREAELPPTVLGSLEHLEFSKEWQAALSSAVAGLKL